MMLQMFSDGKELPREVLIQVSKTNLNLLRGNSLLPELVHECSARAHFEGLESHLISYIDSSEYIVGCVAWITSSIVLSRLARKKVSLIVDASYDKTLSNFDAKLSGYGFDAGTEIYSNIRTNYSSLTSFDSYSAISSIGSESVCAGVAPLMHHKFLVFMDKERHPYSVWTGSFNITNNASRSLENAVLLCGEGIAREYYDEWIRLIKVSSPIKIE